MRRLLLSSALACVLATQSAAQAVVILKDPQYASCQFILDSFESDVAVRSFMIDYVFGFLSGLNAQRSVSGQPVLDFGPIENPMLITWTVQVCRETPTQSIHQALFRLFNVLLNRQQS